MKIRTSALLFTLSIVLGLATGVALYFYLQSLQATQAVMVLKRAVESGTPLTREMVTVTHVPQDAVPEDAVSSWDQLDGKAARGWMPAGTLLRLSHVVPLEEAANPIEAVLGRGMVAMTVPLQMQAGGLLPSPGDRILVYGIRGGGQNEEALIERIGDNVRVLERVGPPAVTTPEQPAGTTGAAGAVGVSSPSEQEEIQPDNVVILVLEVRREQAETIARYLAAGRVFAVLPSAEDQKAAQATVSTARSIPSESRTVPIVTEPSTQSPPANLPPREAGEVAPATQPSADGGNSGT